MPAYGDIDVKIAGLKYGIGESKDESYVVEESGGILPGYPVFGYDADELSAYLFHQDQDTVVFDADFVTGNLIDGTVNGVAITQVPFNTDHDTTMDDLAAAILALTAVTAVTLTDTGGDNRTIQIVTKGVDCVSTFVVTAGASQAVATITSGNSSTLKYLGVSRFEQKEDADLNTWALNDDIPVMARGDIYVVTGEAVDAQTTAYVRTDGTFGTSGFQTVGIFKETVGAAGIARLSIGGQNA